ncbi:MAG: hypothetical protein JWP03_3661 [Phycisphaerales bacterium]|nr:hypothetical protein [Phycisphaerales bacterium]
MDTLHEHLLSKHALIRLFSVLSVSSVVGLLPLLAGCIDHFGTGGTGETVIPEHRVRDIDPTDLHEFAANRPATTQPAAMPAEVNPPPILILSIEECRLAALHNNLDLQVELFNPSIAQTSVTE